MNVIVSKQEGLFVWTEEMDIGAADIDGHLAVHKSLQNPNYWTITHVPTGRAVCKHFLTKSFATRCRSELNRAFNWESPERDDYATVVWDVYRVCAEFSASVKTWLEERHAEGLPS